jgi:Amt family ammonium transporter
LSVCGLVTALTLLLGGVGWADSSVPGTGGAGGIDVGRDLGQSGWERLVREVGDEGIAINFVWTLLCSALVLFMSAGFAMLESGFSRARHTTHVLMTNFVILFISFLGFWAVGFALMFGGTHVASLGGTAPLHGLVELGRGWGIFGTKGWFLSGSAYDVGVAALFMFQVAFMITAATIPTGAMAERWRFAAFAIYGFFISMFLYPIFGNWVWGGGWLSQLGNTLGLGHGYLDWAGSSVIHAVGGLTGLAGTLVLGPRIGKFNRDRSPNPMPAHNLPLAILGTYILIFGWFGFNAGSTLAGTDLRISMIVLNTMLAGCAGGFTAMLLMWRIFGKPDPSMIANGFLAGLVAITAPSAFVQPWSAAVIGVVGGALAVAGVLFIERVWHIDDPVGAVPVHAGCGLWGVLALGLFADGTYGVGINGVGGGVRGLFYGDASQFVAQLVGFGTVIVWAFPLAFGFFKLQHRLMGIRVSREAELEGVDLPEMGAMAYPDFLEAKGEVFTAVEGDGTMPPVEPVIPAGPSVRLTREPGSARPGAAVYHFTVEGPGLHARLPIRREARSGDPFVKELYRTEVLGRRLERGNLPSLETAVRQLLGRVLRDDRVPPYVMRAGGDVYIPIVRHGHRLRAFVQDRPLEGRDLGELCATVTDHLALHRAPGQPGVGMGGEPDILAVAAEDLSGVPPTCVLRYRDLWTPVFARPWGTLYVEVPGQELEAGPGTEGVLALRDEAARLLHEDGRLYDPLDLSLMQVRPEVWAGWASGLDRAEELVTGWSPRPLPAYRWGETVLAEVRGPQGEVSVWFGRDRFDLVARIEAAIRSASFVIRPV